MKHHHHSGPRRGQRGIGTVIVVMVLFFVVSLAAAYASRNMIFEQKTSANQARSTLAFEAAEAGVEWMLTQLNGRTINADCGDSAPTNNFQQRYLSTAANGNVSPAPRSTDADPGFWPACVHDGTGGWTCSCPTGTAAAPTAPTGVAGPLPAFRVWPATPEPTDLTTSPWSGWTATLPGLFPVNAVGCTALPASSADECLNFYSRAQMGEGSASLRVWIALRSGVAVPPSTPVLARLGVVPSTAGGVKLRLVNTDTAAGGLAVNAGQAVDRTAFDVSTLPGTPASTSFVDSDSRLVEVSQESAATGSLTAGERMFALVFGMRRSTYKDQPGLRTCASPCTAAAINTLLQTNPNRPIWVDGDLTVDVDIGTSAAPALLIVDGDNLTLNADRTIYGLVYLTGAGAADSNITLPAGPTNIHGAVVAEGRLNTVYGSTPSAGQELTITFDRTVLDRLRNTYGSWVRVPGGWADFKAVP